MCIRDSSYLDPRVCLFYSSIQRRRRASSGSKYDGEREWVKNVPGTFLISSRVPTSFPKWKLKKGIKKDEQRLRTQSRQSMNTHKTYTNNSPTVRWLRGRLSSRGIGSCSVAPTLGLPRISFFSYLSVSDNGRYTQLDMNVSFKTVSAELLLCALL